MLAPVRAIAISLRSNCSLARATSFEESVIATNPGTSARIIAISNNPLSKLPG